MWRPILDGREAEAARELIHCIAEELERSSRSEGLEEPWIALFFEYLARVEGDAGHRRTAAQLVDLAIDQLAEIPLPPGLHGGYTGTAWLVAHLEREAGASPESDPNAEIDEALLELLEQRPWPGHFDLVEGLVGIGTYALERLPRASAERLLTLVIEHLADKAVRTPVGLAWFTPRQDFEGTDYFNPSRFDLGLAHGNTGIVAMLARACAAGVHAGLAHELLTGAITWIQAQRLPTGFGSRMPHWVGPEVVPREARLAWCYGGLGTAIALLSASRCVGCSEWERAAIEYALAEVDRPIEHTGITDPYFCHGSIGAAHLFNRLYQATGEPRLLAAARTWLARTYEYRDPTQPDAIVGFRAVTTLKRGDGTPLQSRGLISGVTGIGLVLLAAISTIEPAWDRCLQVAIPTGG